MFTSYCCGCCRTTSKSISSSISNCKQQQQVNTSEIIVPEVLSAPEITFDVMDEKELPSWSSTVQYVPNILRGKI